MPEEIKVKRLNTVQKLEYLDGWKNYQFNKYLSDLISINRELEDLRDPE